LVKTTAYLSLGSNLGNREENLREAMSLLKALGTIAAVSSFYETEPVEVEGLQPWFLNVVVALETELTPHGLLAGALEIEREMGRQRTSRRAPRTIDIDIVMFGDTIVNAPGLVIPHPGMQHRRFVLEPLAEIAPQAEHPVLHKIAADLLRELPPAGGRVRRLDGSGTQDQQAERS
jgi:2-amino-4-hydroxy-6-hydroxymethyldihydropteridine diphosphokinase